MSFESLNELVSCPCCGMTGVNTSVHDQKLCMVCAPAFALDDPDADTISTVIWLPQIDQGFLSRLIYAAYSARLVQSNSNILELDLAARSYDVLSELESLRAEAKRIIGTDQVSVLRRLIQHIPQYSLFQRQNRPTGLRVLPLAPWFDIHAQDYRKLIAARK